MSASHQANSPAPSLRRSPRRNGRRLVNSLQGSASATPWPSRHWNLPIPARANGSVRIGPWGFYKKRIAKMLYFPHRDALALDELRGRLTEYEAMTPEKHRAALPELPSRLDRHPDVWQTLGNVALRAVPARAAAAGNNHPCGAKPRCGGRRAVAELAPVGTHHRGRGAESRAVLGGSRCHIWGGGSRAGEDRQGCCEASVYPPGVAVERAVTGDQSRYALERAARHDSCTPWGDLRRMGWEWSGRPCRRTWLGDVPRSVPGSARCPGIAAGSSWSRLTGRCPGRRKFVYAPCGFAPLGVRGASSLGVFPRVRPSLAGAIDVLAALKFALRLACTPSRELRRWRRTGSRAFRTRDRPAAIGTAGGPAGATLAALERPVRPAPLCAAGVAEELAVVGLDPRMVVHSDLGHQGFP